MPRSRSIAERRNRSECISGSPPVNTTHSTPELFDIRQVPLQFHGTDLLCIGQLPDVAHYATTVASIVRLQHQDGKTLQARVHGKIRLPARRRSLPRCFAAARRSPRTSASTSTGGRFSMCSRWNRRRAAEGSCNASSGEISRMRPATTTRAMVPSNSASHRCSSFRPDSDPVFVVRCQTQNPRRSAGHHFVEAGRRQIFPRHREFIQQIHRCAQRRIGGQRHRNAGAQHRARHRPPEHRQVGRRAPD